MLQRVTAAVVSCTRRAPPPRQVDNVAMSIRHSMPVRHGSSIQVILLQDLEKRGVKGDIIDVKRGGIFFERIY